MNRYDLKVGGCDPDCGMEPEPDGEWVRHADAVTLMRKVEWFHCPWGVICPWCRATRYHGHTPDCPAFPPSTP